MPELRIKQDGSPGHGTTARFTPSVDGQYGAVCTELCGQGHATMHNLVVVQDAADYDTWVGQLRANARTAALNPRRADRGKQLIVSGKYPCGSCHLITDAGTSGNVGPHLDGVDTRADTNQDGRLTNRGINPGAPDRVAQYLRA